MSRRADVYFTGPKTLCPSGKHVLVLEHDHYQGLKPVCGCNGRRDA